MKKILFYVFIFTNTVLFAQSREDDNFLSHFPTLKENLGTYEVPYSETVSPPLPKNIRTMAEWEEVQGVAISWLNSNSAGIKTILAEIVKAAKEECNVMILYGTDADLNSCKTTLTSKGIDFTKNVTFILKRTDSVWIRDYGGNTVYHNDVDSLGMVDWIYNRNRPSDDTSAVAVAQFANIPYYQTKAKPEDLVHTGGNFMADGLGTAFSSKLVLTENSATPSQIPTTAKTEVQVDSIMKKFMGITRYPKMEALPFDGIHHIDMHIKLLDEETLIVSEYPTGVADGPQIEANLQYVLKNFKTPYGKNYRVIRIPSPPDATGKFPDKNGYYRTYSNMTILNKSILVPFYDVKYDTTAERILKNAMPGYKIIGINCNAIISQSGAIHCITKELGVKEPLWITHERKTDIPTYAGENIDFTARIQHISGVKEAIVWYKKSTDAVFTALQMSAAGKNQFVATLKGMSNDTKIEYYIEATAKNGKKIARPMVAPTGFYTFYLGKQSTATLDLNPTFSMKVYPNPAKAITCIELENEISDFASVTLLDIFGRTISKIYEGRLEENTSRFFFNATDYQAGTYLVKVKTKNSEQVKKIIITK
jgi:agmatine deiminase